MAMFGSMGALRGLPFDQMVGYRTPGFGDALPPVQPINAMAGINQALAANAAKPAPKPGFFGRGGVGRNIAGNIGDALLQMSGMQPIYGPAMQQQRAGEMEEQRYQRRLRDEMAQWQAQKQWERDNPAPIRNDTVNDYEFIRNTLGDEDARAFLKNKTLPPPMAVDIQNADGSVTRQFVQRNTLPQGGMPSGPPPGTVRNGYRFKGGNPNDSGSWEPIGGAGSGPRTFR